jgi:lipoprotein-anchoring transpeptidase ErfK/SrfK
MRNSMYLAIIPARRHRTIAGIILAVGLAASPVVAQGVEPTPPADFEKGAETLLPGQYSWTPDAAPAGPIAIYVDLARQLAAVYRGGVRIGLSTISSGRDGYETPTGVFKIMSKDADHHSNKYDNAPMPFSERLTEDGVALHAGRVPGYPESHGCVHMPYRFAKALFGETRVGVQVMVTDGVPQQGIDPAPSEVAAIEEGRTQAARAPSERAILVSSERN